MGFVQVENAGKVYYDQENNNSTNALRPRRFKWCDLALLIEFSQLVRFLKEQIRI